MLTLPSFRQTAITLIRLFLVGLLLTTWAGQPRSGYSAPEATVWYVGPGGNDSYPCTTAAKPCYTIQAAIDKATSGGTINIAAKIYIEPFIIKDKSLTLIGRGAASTILDGNHAFQILSIQRESVPSVTVRISGFTLRNGKSGEPGGAINSSANSYLTISNSDIFNNTSSSGGGIANAGTLKLVNVTVRTNSAASEGGGIYNTGSLELNGVLLADNTARNGGGISNRNTVTITASSIASNISNAGVDGGGGIYNVLSTSKLILFNSTLSGNESLAGSSGGAIFNRGILTGTGTTIVENTSAFWGAGIYNDTVGHAVFSSSSVRDNISDFAGGGFFNSGTVRIDRTLITGNKADTAGGGVHNAAGGKLTVITSTISSNTATGPQGGGINNLGTLTMTQSALVFNASRSSTSQGGGLNNAGSARLTNATISDNAASSGSGIQNSGGTLLLQFSTINNMLNNAGGSVTVGNSILARGAGNVCGGTITSADYNLETGKSCGFSGANDLSNANPRLGPLQNNGGGTLTRAIDFSSPARDSANSAATVCPKTDQRGAVRPQPPRQPGSKCDRGAYEVVGYANSDRLDILPGKCLARVLSIDENFAIERMLVGVNLTYPNRHDLTIKLLSPGTPKVTLLGPAANSGQNLDTMFDDSKSLVVQTGYQNPSPPFYENVYKPATPLSQFRGAGIQGDWKLEICNAGTASGTLNRWVMVVPEFSDFKVYMPVIRRD